MRNLASTLIRLFLTGLAALMPLVVTVFVVTWIVGLAAGYIGPSSSFGKFLAMVSGAGRPYAGYLGGYVVVVLCIIILGFLVTKATVLKIQAGINGVLARIPLIGKIYTTVGQVMEIFGNKDKPGLERFGGAVRINMGPVCALGLLVSAERFKTGDGTDHFLVFLPNAPLPATGFIMLVPVASVERLDMPVEDFAKLMMSLGLLAPQLLRGPTLEDSEEASDHEPKPA
jgi:uncharacterized membrane protein